MAAALRTVKASCLCGSNEHSITLPGSDFPLKAYLCHCNSCRHYTGSLCLTAALLPCSYEPDQTLLGKLAAFAFSARITTYFCKRCGCQLISRSSADANDPHSQVSYDIPSGTLEKVDGTLHWVDHQFVQDTLDGGFADMLLEVNDKRLARRPTLSDHGEQLQPYWQSAARPLPNMSLNDKLHAHCKCGGVEFWISRPSARSAVAKQVWPQLPNSEDFKPVEIPSEPETHWLRDKQSKFLAGLCACNSCRLATGTEFISWAFVPLVDLSLDVAGKVPFPNDCLFGTVKKYTSSPGCHRLYCGTCGATCFWDGDDRKFLKDIGVGLLSAPEGSRAESWLGWRTNQYGYREDTVDRAEHFTIGCERGLKAWESQRDGEDCSGPPHTPGAY